MGSANERWGYIVTPSPIGWAYTQTDIWVYIAMAYAAESETLVLNMDCNQ